MAFIFTLKISRDVLLWRALQHVKNGFYIDVGANDPRRHSVTNAFYERGWYGINIEPLERYRQAFRDQRPRDVNLRVAAGAEDGEITLFDVPAMPGGMSSDPNGAGFKEVPYTVPQRTLCSICEEYVSYDIHFLKINVEGYEASGFARNGFCALAAMDHRNRGDCAEQPGKEPRSLGSHGRRAQLSIRLF